MSKQGKMLSLYDNNAECFHHFDSSDIYEIEGGMFQGHLLVKLTFIDGGKRHVVIYPSVELISMGEHVTVPQGKLTKLRTDAI